MEGWCTGGNNHVIEIVFADTFFNQCLPWFGTDKWIIFGDNDIRKRFEVAADFLNVYRMFDIVPAMANEYTCSHSLVPRNRNSKLENRSEPWYNGDASICQTTLNSSIRVFVINDFRFTIYDFYVFKTP